MRSRRRLGVVDKAKVKVIAMQSVSTIQRVASDIFDLCELQMQLLSVDSQVARRKLSVAIVCGLVAVALAGSTITVALLGLGFVLAETFSFSDGVGLLVVGSIAFVAVLALMIFGWFAIRSAAAAMNQTKSEFVENLRWLKATLIAPQKSPRNQLRRETFPKGCESDRNCRVNTEQFNPLSPKAK